MDIRSNIVLQTLKEDSGVPVTAEGAPR